MNQISIPQPHAPDQTEDRFLPGFEETQTRAPGAAHDRKRARTAKWLGAGALIALALAVGWGVWTHAATSQAAAQATKARADAVPQVTTMQVHADNAPQVVKLPGTIQAFDAATLYARATGYISARRVDIGSHVHKGDVLATIAAPDLDQQLAQARAQLVQMAASLRQAIASQGLAKATNQRTSRLVNEGWDSRQQGDQDRTTLSTQTAAIGVAQANLAAQLAQVNRLLELVGFEQVIAPFDGVITARQIDVGNLVTADASTGTSLFSIAQTDRLRVQVYVPQSAFFGMKDGQEATLTVSQLPGRVFHGRVARNAAALAANTRTLLAEVDVDNRDGALSAGLYCTVRLEEPRASQVVTVPTQAVIFNDQGLSVAVVEDGKIAVRKLDVASDDGAQVHVRGGLKDGDRVILNPPVNLVAGRG